MVDNDALRAIMDRQAITDLIHRYCRAVDRIDPELGYSVWHDDAVADYGEAIYQGTGRGVIDHICASHKRALCHFHQASNIIIELDRDRAGSETFMRSTTRFMQGDQVKQVSLWGRYIDRWSRRNGRWGIDKRVYVRDFDELRDAQIYSNAANGRRDASDPSYAVLTRAR